VEEAIVAIRPKTFVADSPATFVPDDAPAEATASAPNPTSHRYDQQVNPFGYMAPVGMVLGGLAGSALGPGGAAVGAGLGGGFGTIWDQNLNRLYHTGFEPQSQIGGDLGVVGNAALGAGSEILPPWLARKVGGAIGPWAYKAALHVDPTLAEAFPKVNVPNEAWAQGAPSLNQRGVHQAGQQIAEHAAEMRRLMDIAQSAHYPEGRQIFEAGHALRTPTTVSREMTFDLPMTDPQAGASPMVDYLPPSTRPRVSPGTDYSEYPLLLHPPGGQTADAFWTRPPSVEQQMISGERPTLMRPRTVLPMEVQQVTHTVQVPGVKTTHGTAPALRRENILTPNVRDLFDKSPQLKRLMSDVGDNLEGATDEGDVKRILDSWFNKNGGITTLNKLATLTRRAGAAGDWVHPSNVGGVQAQQATSPNAKLVGKELRQAIIRYIDNQAESVGVTGLRAARGETQKAIAVREAVRDASLRGTPHLNASGITEKAGIANRLLPPRLVGEFGAHLGGLRPRGGPMMGLRFPAGPAELGGWSGVNALRLAPWLLQQPNNRDSTR